MAEVTLQEAVKKFANDLAKRVQSFVNDVSVLEVRTFTTPHNQVKIFISERPDMTTIANEGNLMLRAYTQVSFDGDTTLCVPVQEDGSVDKGVWEVHTLTVQQAMDNRAKMLKAVGDAATSALGALQKAKE